MPHPLHTRFGQAVRRRREAAGLSQEELAERAGLSRNYVGMVERGESNPTLLVLHGLAAALGTTMTALVREVEADPSSPAGRA
jgi:transcriptional regulator with XRE-family HTH domain